MKPCEIIANTWMGIKFEGMNTVFKALGVLFMPFSFFGSVVHN